MSDMKLTWCSALADLNGAPVAGETSLQITEVTPNLILQIQAWPSAKDNVIEALDRIFGSAPKGREAVLLRDATSLCEVAPGRIIVLSRDQTITFRIKSDISEDIAAITDLSGARTVLRVSGPDVESLLGKGLTIGAALEDFPAGTAQSSAIHHMDVLLIRREAEIFDLAVHRSFAHDMAEWLIDAGLEFGAQLTILDRSGPDEDLGGLADDGSASEAPADVQHS